ncbi:protein lingerer isoform X4 [Lutzomyia longipalpis]|uniref:protein lingerer isoform X4 n=1 Tax=Lutzomyia longipalpis TaxID=7200 RepID=UPI0024843B21|nr:protein lingerer isoform X4 [Lutzomyia longipalpis]
MSTQNRSGGGGGGPKAKKGGNPASSGGNDGNTNKKTDHAKTEKEKPHAKPTAEQIRIAQITDIKGGGVEDAKMQEKVASIMETTQRSEEDVCYALYECDNDLDRAVIFLLETLTEDAFEKTSKKKSKNRTLSTNNNNDGQDGDWDANSTPNTRAGGQGGGGGVSDKERSRSRGGMRGSRMGSDSRGWRGREARENERNAADMKGGDGWRPGRGGRSGNGRGGYGGSRGGRVGRLGRGTGSRDQGRGFSRQPDNLETVDLWDNSQANTTEVKADDTWGDWDNEEYTGSLADSKVFTPSASSQPSMSATSELAAPPGLEQQILNPPSAHADDLVVGVQQFAGGTVVSSTTTAAVVAGTAVINNNNTVQYPELGTAAAQIRQALDMPQMNSSTLSAEQSQYFNSLSSQNSSQTANVNSYQPASVQYPAAYGANSSFGDTVSSQPAVRKTRARVPPPSKIPSSAVEMPGDTLNNIGYLDVQFGGLDFGTEDSFDTLTDKFNTTSLDSAASGVSNPGDVSSDYQSKNSQQSLTAGLQSSQMRTANSVSQSSGSVNNSGVNVINNSAGSGASGGYQVPYTNNTPSKGPTSYQASGTGQGGYSNTNYASTQVSSTNSYPPTTNSYSSYNQNTVNSYQSQNSASNVSAVNNSGNASNSSSTSSIPVGSTGVGNSASATGSTGGYLSSQYPVTQSSSVFPSQPSAYQNSPSVYGNTTGYTGSTNTSTAQYSNFTSTKLKENAATTISTPFESVTSSAVSSSAPSAVSNSTVTTSSMSSPSLGMTKVTSATTKSSGVIPNIPMVSQYIQTAGVPFYQPPVYATYDELQMMQQRMPHVQPEYYNLNYQTPTSLGAGVRDANLGSVAAYSTMSDGRFTRTDNNSSPVSNVPSTMSQQTGSGGPMMNVPYAYFYGGVPGSFQYGMYPQQMATASATSGGQFAKPSYNSAYGSTAYDALSQSTQDYSKNAYPGSGVGQQSKGQNVNNPPQAGTGSDISSSMYSKGHVALSKVNSYDKQSFHSGTPPPFNLAGTQTAGATSAQPYGMYIPAIPPPHHNLNMHQPIHQDSNSSGQRPQSSSQGKAYWTAQN